MGVSPPLLVRCHNHSRSVVLAGPPVAPPGLRGDACDAFAEASTGQLVHGSYSASLHLAASLPFALQLSLLIPFSSPPADPVQSPTGSSFPSSSFPSFALWSPSYLLLTF